MGQKETQYLKKIAQSANKLNSLYTSMQTDFNTYANNAVEAQRANNQYNAQQAQIQRDWQEEMSATAHQREVNDLKAAGLNPILSAYGAGASVGSGAAATSDNSLSQVFGQLANSAISAMSDMAKALNTNATTLNLGMYQADISRKNAKTSAAAQMESAEKSANATVYSANKILEGTMYTADKNAETNLYIAKLQSWTNLTTNEATNAMNLAITKLNNQTSQIVAKISGEYGIRNTKLNNFIQKYAAELSYAACIEAGQYSADKSLEGTLAQVAQSEFNIEFSSASGVISTIINMVGSVLGSGMKAKGKKG